LASSDFHLLGLFKEAAVRRIFWCDENIRECGASMATCTTEDFKLWWH
jgi:hypothetical protein